MRNLFKVGDIVSFYSNLYEYKDHLGVGGLGIIDEVCKNYYMVIPHHPAFVPETHLFYEDELRPIPLFNIEGMR